MSMTVTDRKDRIVSKLTELMAIPSVTGTPGEARAADWIYRNLKELPWFSVHPECLQRMTRPLPEAERPMEAVLAVVRSLRPTRKTLLFIGHMDVVDVDVYGKLDRFAYDPEALEREFRQATLPDEVARDLAGDDFIFGRGSMDMKAGVALEMDLIEEFACDRELFDVNVAMLIVGDEEGNNGGMRAAVPFLVERCRELELDVEAVINTEPSDAGLPGNTEPVIFSGTMGKVMPFFYVLGRPSHVGNYYHGLSAALLISRINAEVEANADLADSAFGETTLPPICLAQGTRERGYSVTVPDRAFAYFNYVTVGKTPSRILNEMVRKAQRAVGETERQLHESRERLSDKGYACPTNAVWDMPVFSFAELTAKTKDNAEYDAGIRAFLDELDPGLDLREKGLRFVEKVLELSALEGPLVVVGMLPPFLPQRTSLGDSPREVALREAVETMKTEARHKYGITFAESVFFAGLCDLSYVGSDLDGEELQSIAENMPGWGDLYSVPVEAMSSLDCPVVNIGPEGRDAHRMTERLEKEFSLVRLPNLLRTLVRHFVPAGDDRSSNLREVNGT